MISYRKSKSPKHDLMKMINRRHVSNDDQLSDLDTVTVFNRFNALIELEEDMTVSEKYSALIDVNECTAQEILPKKNKKTCRAFGNAQVNTTREKLTEAACKYHCRPTRSTQKELSDAKENLDEVYNKGLEDEIKRQTAQLPPWSR